MKQVGVPAQRLSCFLNKRCKTSLVNNKSTVKFDWLPTVNCCMYNYFSSVLECQNSVTTHDEVKFYFFLYLRKNSLDGFMMNFICIYNNDINFELNFMERNNE